MPYLTHTCAVSDTHLSTLPPIHKAIRLLRRPPSPPCVSEEENLLVGCQLCFSRCRRAFVKSGAQDIGSGGVVETILVGWQMGVGGGGGGGGGGSGRGSSDEVREGRYKQRMLLNFGHFRGHQKLTFVFKIILKSCSDIHARV